MQRMPFSHKIILSSDTRVSKIRTMTSTTALSMNLFDRFARVAKANLNNVLKSLEEPEKILNQAIEDMQVRFTSSYYFVFSIQIFIRTSLST